MRVNWSNLALRELKAISTYIQRDNVPAADRVTTRIVDEVAGLASMPGRGTPGRISGTREMFFPPWPYFVVYRIVGEELRIMHVRHGARRWPVQASP